MDNILAKVLPQDQGLEVSTSGKYNAAIAIMGLMALVGVAAGLHAFFIGHDHAFGNTRDVPWGLLIAAYVFFVVTSTGLCLVSSIGHVFGVQHKSMDSQKSIFSKSFKTRDRIVLDKINFDTYFNQDGESIARYTCQHASEEIEKMEERLNHKLNKRLIFMVYNCLI